MAVNCAVARCALFAGSGCRAAFFVGPGTQINAIPRFGGEFIASRAAGKIYPVLNCKIVNRGGKNRAA